MVIASRDFAGLAELAAQRINLWERAMTGKKKPTAINGGFG